MTGEGKFKPNLRRNQKSWLNTKEVESLRIWNQQGYVKSSSGLWLLPETADYMRAATSLIIAIGGPSTDGLASSNMTNINSTLTNVSLAKALYKL